MAGLPLPVPDEDSQPFWDYCAQGELRAQRCSSCGVLRHPSRPRCRECGSPDFEWVALSGRGSVYTYAISHQAIHPALVDFVPHGVVIVELDEGLRMNSNIVDCPVDEIAIGTPVQVVFEKASDEITLPKFRRA
jgi:uncharacterized OB-fold protein